jgi:hypothetical protein
MSYSRLSLDLRQENCGCTYNKRVIFLASLQKLWCGPRNFVSKLLLQLFSSDRRSVEGPKGSGRKEQTPGKLSPERVGDFTAAVVGSSARCHLSGALQNGSKEEKKKTSVTSEPSTIDQMRPDFIWI